jgi:hypothetical protein
MSLVAPSVPQFAKFNRPRRGLRPLLGLGCAFLCGLLLRLWFITHFAHVAGDSLLYGDIAKNWLEHGIYGFTQATAAEPTLLPEPTLIRLPGFPAFLALCFAVFGLEHYTAVLYVQAGLDLLTCMVVALLSGRLFGRRAFWVVLWLGVLCPFTANYAAAPLAETLTLTCIAVAYYALYRWQMERAAGPYNRWLYVLAATLSYAILLRPEQGMLATSVLPAMLWAKAGSDSKGWVKRSLTSLTSLTPVVLCGVLVVLPLVPWAVRNWRTFHVFQPLAPRYATDPGEVVPLGFQRWYRTWAIDFASTEDVYWNYDGDRIEISDLPARAFDSEAQYNATDALLNDYNQTAKANASLDASFDVLAAERIAVNPVRYYLALPVARVLNMALRPRTEMLPVPLEWWKFHEHPGKTVFATDYALLNLAYFVLAGLGLWRWHRMRDAHTDAAWNGQGALAWSMVASVVLRGLLLLTLDNSEPRYTLEFYPVFLVAIGALAARRGLNKSC